MKKGNFKTLPVKKFGTRDQVWKTDEATDEATNSLLQKCCKNNS